MRLVIDMQGAQTASRFRGIGRYTMALAKEMARQRGEHEIILALNAAYADTIEPIRAAFAELLPFEAIRVFEVAGPVSGHDSANDARRKAAEAMVEAFLSSLQPDVVFIPSLFEGFEGEAVTSVHCLHNAIPTVVTLHDLIPLVHRGVYLQDPPMERWYFNKLDHLRRADLFLAVSEASGREAVQYLNVLDSAVVTVANACDAHFRLITLSDAQHAHLKHAYGIDRPFVMNTGGIDHRKDVHGLFRAFSKLPSNLRREYALVLVGWEAASEKTRLLSLAQQAGLRDDELVFTGYVSDQDLALLYNACTLFVFPSWHEGFGLPVLEAMCCGKAVIAANSSSLPEVVGRQDALFAPRDDAAMATKIAEVLGNPEFRQELERHGLEQAKKFSWTTSASRAWGTMESLHKIKQQENPAWLPLLKRPRLAFVSPLPPEKSGIADYAAELLPELSRHFEITAIVQQEQVRDAWVQANVPVHDVDWFKKNADRFDRILYHFGNSIIHEYMFNLLADHPGVVVLHDFYLSAPVFHRDHHGSAPHSWVRALFEEHGWHIVRERFQAQSWDAIVDLVKTFPCNLAVLQQSLGIIVHSDFSRQLARQFYGDQAVDGWALIPHLRQPVELVSKGMARQLLGLAETDFVVCSFGVIGSTKLNHRLLAAWLATPLAKDSHCHLVFVGENPDESYGQDLVQKIAQSPSKDRISITGRADTDSYRTWLTASDIGVQLRTFSRGETSGTVLDCMNYGLPTIVNAHGSMADLPKNAVWMLPDKFDDDNLVEAITGIWRYIELRTKLGSAAKAYIYANHNPHHCSNLYAQAIEAAYDKANKSFFGFINQITNDNKNPGLIDLSKLSLVLANNFPKTPKYHQVFLDVSVLVVEDAKTGIQRVVRALMMELIINPPKGWMIHPIYMPVGESTFRHANKFTSCFLGIKDDWVEDHPIQLYQGDVYISLDLNHHVSITYEHIFQEWRRRGVRLYAVVYDLLPATMPEVFPAGTDDLHHRWLHVIAKFDGALCISRAVADELFDWLQTFGQKRDRPYQLNWFHLGSDVDNSAPSLGLPTDGNETLHAIKSRHTFLMVGTLEPRKGYLQTLHAFDALWAQGADVNLVIVGKEGWESLPDAQRRDIPQTVHALRNHPELGKRLFWLDGISDEYLELVYAHATCLIAASYDEGFGLPLIEASRHGVPLLARDIPVFREVTDGHAYLFADTREPETIALAVQDWLALYTKGEHPHGDAVPHQTWKDSAQQVVAAILGQREPYKMWLPDGMRRYWGADPRLSTEIGKRCGKSMCTTGKAGMLIYGPYERFEPGPYRLTVSGVAEHWTGEEWLDISANHGKKKFLKSIINEPALGQWEVVYEFDLSEDIADLEVRLWVNELSDLQVDTFQMRDLRNIVTTQQLIKRFTHMISETNAFVPAVDDLFEKYRSDRGDCDLPMHQDYVMRLVRNTLKTPQSKTDYKAESIFQYWDQEEIPDFVRSNIDQNKIFAERYEIFSRMSAHEFIKKNFDDPYLMAFDLCWHPAMRSDYFRLLKLYVNGGVYLDADDLLLSLFPTPRELAKGDYLMLMPLAGIHTPEGFSAINPRQICDLFRDENVGHAGLSCYFSNNYISCNRFNPIIALCVYKATHDILHKSQSELSIHGTTGPGLVSVATQVYSVLSVKYDLPNCQVIALGSEGISFQTCNEKRYITDDYVDWRSDNKPPAEFSSRREMLIRNRGPAQE